jgi:hypothetical protein
VAGERLSRLQCCIMAWLAAEEQRTRGASSETTLRILPPIKAAYERGCWEVTSCSSARKATCRRTVLLGALLQCRVY